MRKAGAIFGIVLFVAVLGTASADAGPIRITKMSCGGEYVDIRNTSNSPKNLGGFRLYDKGRVHRFDYPSERLPPGASARVWADGKSGGPIRRWWTGWNGPVWGSNDRAQLVNPHGDVVSARDCDDGAPPPPPGNNCNPNYTPCVPNASDVDCAGGSGNGPAYVQGPVRVIGNDVYDLDSDNDGIGCE